MGQLFLFCKSVLIVIFLKGCEVVGIECTVEDHKLVDVSLDICCVDVRAVLTDSEVVRAVERVAVVLGSELAYEEEYLPKRWKNISEEDKAKGHGGMDDIMFSEFVDAIIEKKPMPIDVYDAAAWMCITCLSEKSIANGGEPQEIPDFTNGKYKKREIKDVLSWK